jgi:hypothetical protein
MLLLVRCILAERFLGLAWKSDEASEVPKKGVALLEKIGLI